MQHLLHHSYPPHLYSSLVAFPTQSHHFPILLTSCLIIPSTIPIFIFQYPSNPFPSIHSTTYSTIHPLLVCFLSSHVHEVLCTWPPSYHHPSNLHTPTHPSPYTYLYLSSIHQIHFSHYLTHSFNHSKPPSNHRLFQNTIHLILYSTLCVRERERGNEEN